MNANKMKKSVAVSYIAVFFYFCYQLLLTPLLIRTLGPSEYGLYSVTISIQSYLILLHAGISSAYNLYYFRYLADNDEKKIRQLNSVILGFFWILGLAGATVVFFLSFTPSVIFGKLLAAEEIVLAGRMLRVFSAVILVTLLEIPFQIFVYAREKFIFFRSVQTLRYIVTTLLVGGLLLAGFRSLAALSGLFVVYTLYLLGVAFYSLRVLQIRFCYHRISLFCEGLRAGHAKLGKVNPLFFSGPAVACGGRYNDYAVRAYWANRRLPRVRRGIYAYIRG